MEMISSYIFGFVSLYLDLLKRRPILTKSLTSAVIAATGNFISQKIKARVNKDGSSVVQSKGELAGDLNYRSVISFFVYGLAVIGPLTHHFYWILEQLVPTSSSLFLLKRIVIDRFIFTPFLVLVTVVTLEILQEGRFETVSSAVNSRYLITLVANWKVWTIPQFFNVNFVPEEFRPLFANVVALGWCVYLANIDAAAKRTIVVNKELLFKR